MSFLKGILTDLRHRKLWPVPLALLAAIVAVPVVLAKKPASAPVPPAPTAGEPTSGTPAAAISVSNSDGAVRLSGHGRDPFTQQAVAKAATSAGTAIGAATTASGGTSFSASSAGVSSGSGTSLAQVGTPTGGLSTLPSTGGTAGGTSNGTPAPVVPPNAKPTVAPTGLTGTEAYRVALSITNSSGGVDPIDPVERDSLLPSTQHPLIVELGVLQGGHSVLFAVQPGTSVSGPGTCTPGPIDCEILSVGQDQTENASGGGVSTSFAVTAITADHYTSVAAADSARRKVSAAGSKLLSQSTLGALALFQYQPSVGAVVDQRNLIVGGN